MDYTVRLSDGTEMLLEQQKNEVKEYVISEYIRLRKEKGLSQEDISRLTGIARPNISRTESGKYDPTLSVLMKLAYALDMELEIKFVEKGSKK